MFSLTITLYWNVIGAVAALLLIFSVAFNIWITSQDEKDGFISGNTAWLVVVGVLVTLGGVAIVSWQVALIAFIGFIFSGPVMIWGEHDREIKRIRRKADDHERKETERLEREHTQILDKTRHDR